MKKSTTKQALAIGLLIALLCVVLSWPSIIDKYKNYRASKATAEHVPLREATDTPQPDEKLMHLLSDGYWKGLTDKMITEAEFISIYGPPLSVREESAVRYLSYNFSDSDAYLKRFGGRVGFDAIFKDGRLVKMEETYRQ